MPGWNQAFIRTIHRPGYPDIWGRLSRGQFPEAGAYERVRCLPGWSMGPELYRGRDPFIHSLSKSEPNRPVSTYTEIMSYANPGCWGFCKHPTLHSWNAATHHFCVGTT